MSSKTKIEYWLRGQLPDTPLLLQPIAHALLQARDEMFDIMVDFPEEKLWEKPFAMASVGFHLQHLTGVLDRLFTYAKKEMLTPAQLAYLSTEGDAAQKGMTVENLLAAFSKQVDVAIEQLNKTDEAMLNETRFVGRAKVPSTQIGLFVHSAEHTMRHTGQLLVTVKILKSQ